ncbi:MAG: esterase-like activity of phytase family protein [Saprospiraceae bacterium]|nr:esterase-like activity of phytase family protein [Saprospiraceae bacterium]
MKTRFFKILSGIALAVCIHFDGHAQIKMMNDYKNYHSARIGTYQGILFREAGFSSLYPIAGSHGTEFWTCSDRGVNVDAANANDQACRPTYDKIFPFPSYIPKIHRLRIAGDSIQILQTIPILRPNGQGASGLVNPTGFGSTASEQISTDTVNNCSAFQSKTTLKDTFGIDCEGLVVDPDGNFWLCEEGGPTVWQLNKAGVLIKRYSPYANLPGAHPVDVLIDTVFKYRKNNRGFEGIAITPSGKIYVAIQSPLLFPSKSAGENTRIHRLLEIDPKTNATRMFAYLNDGIIGKGGDQIRLRDWKIGDLYAINDHEFLVLEAAARGTTDIKRLYRINLSNATPVRSGLFNNNMTLEQLVDSTGLAANQIRPVEKTLVMDLLAEGWPASLDKAEGISILNDSTIVIGNDNDFGQFSPDENGIAMATGKESHLIVFRLSGKNKISRYREVYPVTQGLTGPSTNQSPYVLPAAQDVQFTSILTVGESANGYTLCGIPDGMGAYDNGDGSFTILLNHEFGTTAGAVRAHGSTGAFISKWKVRKSDLKVLNGEDLVKKVNLWNGTGYTEGTTAFARLCSADLPPYTAFYHKSGIKRLGTMTRLFLNGEETGDEGRAFAHIATGVNTGTSYELPYLGKASWENVVAHPESGVNTLVALLDDSNGGQVYFYLGKKGTAGNEIDRAGLSKGKLFGLKVENYPVELDSVIPASNQRFSIVDLGTVQNKSGAELNTMSNANAVTQFKRPEDGTWIQGEPNVFYFVTTNAFNAPSRLWKIEFDDIQHPEKGGTIEIPLDGTEGQKMFDNMCSDSRGNLLLQEDVGNNARLGKIWQYNISTDELKTVGDHDPTRFINGAHNFLTQDEESSGIIDVRHILGHGMFLLVDQAHYPLPGQLVQGGQILAMYNPDSDKPSKLKNPVPGLDSGSILDAIEQKTKTSTAKEFQQHIRVGELNNQHKLVIYPNPISSGQLLTLEGSTQHELIYEIGLINSSGQLIWNEKISEPANQYFLELSEKSVVSPGMYYLYTITNFESHLLKLFVE